MKCAIRAITPGKHSTPHRWQSLAGDARTKSQPKKIRGGSRIFAFYRFAAVDRQNQNFKGWPDGAGKIGWQRQGLSLLDHPAIGINLDLI